MILKIIIKIKITINKKQERLWSQAIISDMEQYDTVPKAITMAKAGETLITGNEFVSCELIKKFIKYGQKLYMDKVLKTNKIPNLMKKINPNIRMIHESMFANVQKHYDSIISILENNGAPICAVMEANDNILLMFYDQKVGGRGRQYFGDFK